MPGLNTGGQGDPDDDGSADPAVTAALAGYASGVQSEHGALTALAASRLLVPIVALLTETWAGAEAETSAGAGAGAEAGDRAGPVTGARSRAAGLRREKTSEMALPTLVGRDGRHAILAFTCLESLARWRPDARPVPVPAARVWEAGQQEASAVVIDVAGPVPFAVEGTRLAALAAGQPVPLPHEDPEVQAAAADAVASEQAIAGVRLAAGDGATDLTLEITLAGAGGTGQAQEAIGRAAERLMTAAGGRLRRGMQVVVVGGSAA